MEGLDPVSGHEAVGRASSCWTAAHVALDVLVRACP